MRKVKTELTTLILEENTTLILSQLAEKLGYLKTTSVQEVESQAKNISAMVQAIASGTLLILDTSLFREIEDVYWTYTDIDDIGKGLDTDAAAWGDMRLLLDRIFKGVNNEYPVILDKLD